MEDIQNKLNTLSKLNISSFTRSCIQIVFIPIFFITILLSFFLGIVFLVIGMIGTGALYFLFTGNPLNMSMPGGLPQIIVFGTTFLGFYGLFKLVSRIDPVSKLKTKVEKIGKLYKESESGKIEHINTILASVEDIYSYIVYIQKLVKFRFLFTEGSKKKIQELMGLSISICTRILEDASMDLQNQIQDIKNTLEESKKDLSTVVGSLEGESLGGLQRMRIDKQIEQFEELQKVLVRV